jgi:hypothetical protein
MMKDSGFNGFFNRATFATEKSSTVENVSKATQRTGFVFAAFVAAHGA